MTRSEIAGEYDITIDMVDPRWEPAWTVAPQQLGPLIHARPAVDGGAPVRRLETTKWGFETAWMKPGQPRPINSRIEKLTGGMWRGALNGARAAVPMSGYVEFYTAEDGKKTPVFLHSDRPLLAAALYAGKQDETGQWQHTFSIVTRTARDHSGEIHDRMPCFIDQRSPFLDHWLSPERPENPQGLVDELTAESEKIAPTLTSYEISRRFNNTRTARRDDSTLLDPVAD